MKVKKTYSNIGWMSVIQKYVPNALMNYLPRSVQENSDWRENRFLDCSHTGHIDISFLSLSFAGVGTNKSGATAPPT